MKVQSVWLSLNWEPIDCNKWGWGDFEYMCQAEGRRIDDNHFTGECLVRGYEDDLSWSSHNRLCIKV